MKETKYLKINHSHKWPNYIDANKKITTSNNDTILNQKPQYVQDNFYTNKNANDIWHKLHGRNNQYDPHENNASPILYRTGRV